MCLTDCPTLDHVSGIALPQNNTVSTPGDATSCQRQDCHLVIVVSYQPPEGNGIGLKLNRNYITFGMSHLTPPNSTHNTPKRKRGSQDSGYPSSLISRLKTDNLPNRSTRSPEYSDEASPRSVVAGRLQDLKLQPQDQMSNLDPLTPPSGHPSPLKRKAANVSFDFTHAYQSIEPTDSSKPIVHFKLPPSPESPVLEIPETPRLTPLRSPSDSPARQYAAMKSKSKSRSPAPKAPTALWWTDSEITGHDPSDPTDDGYGINGVGFVPTPAMANARSERRRRQVAEWKMREAREARQKRSERRWKRDVNLGTVGDGSGLEVSEERRVRFLEV